MAEADLEGWAGDRGSWPTWGSTSLPPATKAPSYQLERWPWSPGLWGLGRGGGWGWNEMCQVEGETITLRWM